ncbi:MAG: hypothetical protein ACYSWU_17585, partial [Planctomycetota bacterium]
RGTYWLTYFRLDSGRLAEIERQCQLNESILRKLFLKVDPRIVDTLVAHAQAAHLPAARAEQGKETSAPKAESKQDEDTTADDRKESDVSQVADEGSP